MDTAKLLLLLTLWLAVVATGRGDDVPKRFDFARYSPMLKTSPFAVASVVQQQVAPPSIFKDLYLSNAGHTKDGDMITIMSAIDRNLKEYVSTNEVNDHGYKIISIEWSDKVGLTKATVSKDGQVGTISFNQALMSQPAAPGPAPGPGMVAPGQVPPPAPTAYVPPKPPSVPAVATPVPHVRGLIQRNPSSSQVGPAFRQPAAQPPQQPPPPPPANEIQE